MKNNSDMDLKSKKWKAFAIGDIFNVFTGSLLSKKVLKKGKIARITATDLNNGIFNHYQKVNHRNYRVLQNFISISFLGSVFYHPYIASLDMKIHAIQIPEKELNKYLAKFIVLALKRITSVFSYGNQLSSSDLPKKKILLPTTAQGKPDYLFMERYMKKLEQKKLQQCQQHIKRRFEKLKNTPKVMALHDKKWKSFFIENIVDILSGKDIYNAERVKGNIPYASATANNNGIGHFVSNDNHTKEAGCISVNRNGSVGYAFYHPYETLFSNDCRKLKLKQDSKFIGLFIAHQITKQRGKYGYGYKMGTARLKRQKIMLPINDNQEPDYDYMESYMKRLEYEKLKQYLDYKQLY